MTPALLAQARSQLGLFTAQQAYANGLGVDEVKRNVRSGRWVAVRRGIYCTADARPHDAAQRHQQDAMAVILSVNTPTVASHWTAASAAGLPLIRPLPQHPQVVADREHRRGISGAQMFAGYLKPGHVDDFAAPPRTVIARTISDIARTRAVDDALVMLEFSLREGRCSRGDLVRIITDCPTWRGIVWTKRILEWAQPLNESPGETLSLLRMREHNIPLPLCQVPMLVLGRRCRPDFVWPELGLIGEFDGALKYQAREVLRAEKAREDDLRAAGWWFVRWGWSDVAGDGAPLAAKLRAGFAQAAKVEHDRSVLRGLAS